MGQLIDGRWHDQWYDTQKDGRFQISGHRSSPKTFPAHL